MMGSIYQCLKRKNSKEGFQIITQSGSGYWVGFKSGTVVPLVDHAKDPRCTTSLTACQRCG